MYSDIYEILIMDYRGVTVFSYQIDKEKELIQADKQLISGFLSAIKSFGTHLGYEIKSINLYGLKIYYRIIKSKKEYIIIGIVNPKGNENNIKIRMEMLSYLLVYKYPIISYNTPEEYLNKLNSEVAIILQETRDNMNFNFEYNYLSILINELVSDIPIKVIFSYLKKFKLIYDIFSENIIVPCDLGQNDEIMIVNNLKNQIIKLYGNKKWESANKQASDRYISFQNKFVEDQLDLFNNP
ncbi:MAG: hypothetical protein ACXAC7_21485 [Candidatus Hodarchaeales archaeon]|jgi:hypothetical protein